MRIDRIVKRWGEFADDTVMVEVFDADIGDLSKRMGKRDIPFTILADGDYELFARHGVESPSSDSCGGSQVPHDICARVLTDIFL